MQEEYQSIRVIIKKDEEWILNKIQWRSKKGNCCSYLYTKAQLVDIQQFYVVINKRGHSVEMTREDDTQRNHQREILWKQCRILERRLDKQEQL